MAHGIFKGLVWGSVAGIGIIALANQVVDTVPTPVVQEDVPQGSADIAPLNESVVDELPVEEAIDEHIDLQHAAEQTVEEEDSADSGIDIETADKNAASKHTELDSTAAKITDTESKGTENASGDSENTSGNNSGSTKIDKEYIVPTDAPRETIFIAPTSDKDPTTTPSEAAPAFDTPADQSELSGGALIDTKPNLLKSDESIDKPEDVKQVVPTAQEDLTNDLVVEELPVVPTLEAEADVPDFANDTPGETQETPSSVQVTEPDAERDEGVVAVEAVPDLPKAEIHTDFDKIVPSQKSNESTASEEPLVKEPSSEEPLTLENSEDTAATINTATDTLLQQERSTEPPVVLIDDVPALWAYSAEFEGSLEKPDISLILVDIGRVDLDASVLNALPFPVTFAVDAFAPQAIERAQMYRELGFEVLAMTGVAPDETATEAGDIIRQTRQLLPMSVGFLDVPTASFQASEDIAKQVIYEAQTSGHGVVSFANDTRILTDIAYKANAPVALVQRDIDGKGQDGLAIERALDRASFQAGIDENTVILGRLHHNTLTALTQWAQGSRSTFVEMVPVSTVLQNQVTQN